MTPFFTDRAGKEWKLLIDINALRRVRDMLNVQIGDLRTLLDNVTRLEYDDLFVADFAFACCQPEIVNRDITRDEFCKLIQGEKIVEIHEIIKAGLRDFFRDKGRRALVAETIKNVASLHAAEEKSLIDSISSISATNSQASSASSPANTPSHA